MNYFVTGGSRGIGAGIVLQAVEDGHDVAFAYRGNKQAADAVIAAAAQRRPGAKVRGYVLDVGDSAQVTEVADQVLDEFEDIGVVVNCAGVNRDNLLVSMSDEEWAQVIAVNLSGPFYVIRAFLQNMLANRFGRIINISSIQNNGGTGQGNYAASKAGLHGLTKTVAKEYGRKGITANVVVPGFFDTDMTRETMPQQNKDYWKQYCPMPKGRMGEIAEIAKVVTFLAAPGGGFINGEVINVTGGLNWTY
ncbi:MAG: SDR family oxidoreductase [Nannocystaceae bacterium]|nr:SDR family oxidoreductase [Myxococcales bacterium]